MTRSTFLALFAILLSPMAANATVVELDTYAILQTDFDQLRVTVGEVYPTSPGSPEFTTSIETSILTGQYGSGQLVSDSGVRGDTGNDPYENYGWAQWQTDTNGVEFYAGQDWVSSSDDGYQQGMGFSSLDFAWQFSVTGSGAVLSGFLGAGTGSASSFLYDLSDNSLLYTYDFGRREIDSLGEFSLLDGHSYLNVVSLANSANSDGWEAEFGLYVSGGEIAVPEPATLALFGLGLAGMGFARRRKQLA